MFTTTILLDYALRWYFACFWNMAQIYSKT